MITQLFNLKLSFFLEIVVEEEIVVVVPAIVNVTQSHDDNSTNNVDENGSRVEATTNGIAANDVDVVEVDEGEIDG